MSAPTCVRDLAEGGMFGGGEWEKVRLVCATVLTKFFMTEAGQEVQHTVKSSSVGPLTPGEVLTFWIMTPQSRSTAVCKPYVSQAYRACFRRAEERGRYDRLQHAVRRLYETPTPHVTRSMVLERTW